MSGFPNSKAYPWALTGIFAAVHLVLSIIPAFPGIGGGSLSLGMISGPLVGFLLGPIYGTLSVLIGSILGLWVNPTVPLLGPFTIFPPTVGAFAAGAIRDKRPILVIPALAYAFFLYLVSPIGLAAIGFIWLHTIAAVLLFLFFIPKFRDSFNVKNRAGSNYVVGFAATWVLSFIALMIDHLIGSGLGVYWFWQVFNTPTADLVFIFMTIVLPLYPIERLLMCTALAIVLFSVDRAIDATEFQIPLIQDVDVGIEELPEEEIENH